MNIFKFGLSHYKKYWFWGVICLIFGQIITYIGLVFPQLIQLIVDYVLSYDPAQISTGSNPFAFLVNGNFGSPQTWQLFISIGVAFVVMLFVRHILHYLRFNISHWYGVKYENDFRRTTFRKLLTQNNTVLARYSAGDLLTILNNDTIQFKELYVFTIPFIIDKFFLIGIATFLLFGVNPYLAITPFAISPILIIVSYLYMKRARSISDKIRNSTADLTQTVQENINGVRIVRSLAREEYELEKFDKANAKFRDTFYEHTSMWTKYGFIFNLIRILTFLASMALGSILAIQGKISIGDYVAFNTYVLLIMDAITQLVNLLFQVQQFLVAGRRIYNFVNIGDIVTNGENSVSINEKTNIKFEDMTMMIDDAIILKDINLDIPYGKKVGIMGNTGSGKSVLLKSLSRFYDPYRGAITINGVNIKSVDLENLRHKYAYVFQDVFLFSNTIDANIAYYNDKIEHEKVVEVAKIAKAYNFITELPDGFDTIVGENGTGLSGGQKQRISIARALLKNADVLILDSATSALDHDTEAALMKDVLSYTSGTIIIASHKASSVVMCDEIIYMEHGEIVERGTHDELMKLNGKYAKVYNVQTYGNTEEVLNG